MSTKHALIVAKGFLQRDLETQSPGFRRAAERALKELEGVEEMTEEQATALYTRIIEEDKRRHPLVDRLPVQSLENVWEEHGPRRSTFEDEQAQRWRDETQGFLNDVRGVKR